MGKHYCPRNTATNHQLFREAFCTRLSPTFLHQPIGKMLFYPTLLSEKRGLAAVQVHLYKVISLSMVFTHQQELECLPIRLSSSCLALQWESLP